MATLNTKLARTHRLYIGNTATPVDDIAFTPVTNENEIQFKYTADFEEVTTKESGGNKVALSGSESYELTFTANQVYTDPGLVLARASRNKHWKWQIRDCSGVDEKVWIEGTFILTGLDDKMSATSVIETSGTLKSAGEVIENAVPRALFVD
ncbi:MAG: phage tail protein [Pseudomonadaceae bacterium]|nr:phage tail protein [Pseudomonadaceae bacterium]